MAGDRARGLLLAGLAVLVPAFATAVAAVRDVAELPDATGLVAEAANHPPELRARELELLELYGRGDDEAILRRLRSPDVASPKLAAALHETMAGLYLRERRLYRAGQHLAAIPATLRTPQAEFFEVNIAARQRRLEVALAGLNKLARALPDDPVIARDQAQIASLLADHGTVVAACERLLRLRPDDEFAGFQLGRARMLQGRVKEARATFETLLARNPGHGGAALNLGLLQLARGDLRAARNSFVAARAVEAGNATPYVAEAATALLAGRRSEAREAVAAAAKRNASDPLVGLVDLLARGNTPAALASPASPAVAASLYPDLARAALPPSIRAEIGPAPVAGRIAAASLLLEAWSAQAAFDWLSAQTTIDLAGPLAEMTSIRALVSSGQLQEARRRVTRLESGPKGRDLAGPAVQAAEIAARVGDRDEAVRAMQRATNAAPDLPRLRMLSGDLYNALGLTADAVTEYRTALRGLPDDARLMNQLAATMAVAGPASQYPEALRLAEDGLRRKPHYRLRAWLLDTRADLLFRLGRTDEAYAAYRELSTTVGGMTTPEAWHRLGDLALGAAEEAEARRAFEEALDLGRDYQQRSRAVEQLERLRPYPPRK